MLLFLLPFLTTLSGQKYFTFWTTIQSAAGSLDHSGILYITSRKCLVSSPNKRIENNQLSTYSFLMNTIFDLSLLLCQMLVEMRIILQGFRDIVHSFICTHSYTSEFSFFCLGHLLATNIAVFITILEIHYQPTREAELCNNWWSSRRYP